MANRRCDVRTNDMFAFGRGKESVTKNRSDLESLTNQAQGLSRMLHVNEKYVCISIYKTYNFMAFLLAVLVVMLLAAALGVSTWLVIREFERVKSRVSNEVDARTSLGKTVDAQTSASSNVVAGINAELKRLKTVDEEISASQAARINSTYTSTMASVDKVATRVTGLESVMGVVVEAGLLGASLIDSTAAGTSATLSWSNLTASNLTVGGSMSLSNATIRPGGALTIQGATNNAVRLSGSATQGLVVDAPAAATSDFYARRILGQSLGLAAPGTGTATLVGATACNVDGWLLRNANTAGTAFDATVPRAKVTSQLTMGAANTVQLTSDSTTGLRMRNPNAAASNVFDATADRVRIDRSLRAGTVNVIPDPAMGLVFANQATTVAEPTDLSASRITVSRRLALGSAAPLTFSSANGSYSLGADEGGANISTVSGTSTFTFKSPGGAPIVTLNNAGVSTNGGAVCVPTTAGTKNCLSSTGVSTTGNVCVGGTCLNESDVSKLKLLVDTVLQ